jgi:hypothetical protein
VSAVPRVLRAAGAALALVVAVAAPAQVSDAAALRSSCRAIAHIGDSISVGMDSRAYIPRASDRLRGRYEALGAARVELDISGARSVVEHLEGQRNGFEAARQIRKKGFEGCWVIALGTNDAANVAVGSGYGASERIDRMMAVIGDDPVLWIDVVTRARRGAYAEEHMERFNQALAKAHARYPQLQVYEWSDDALDQWFTGDGIHYTADGYAYRAALIAGAVAEAFPA